MARIDDYQAARELALQRLSSRPLSDILKTTGFERLGGHQFRVSFLDRTYLVDFPDLTFKDQQDPAKEVPIQEQVLILHYMLPEPIPVPSGKWIAYREIPGAAFYFSAFVKRAIEPLKKVFGQNTAGLVKASTALDGKKVASGDAAFEFAILPNVPLQVILWAGDDEFPAEANILFDQTIGDILSPEDAAWLAGMLVYRLISISYR